MHERAGDPSTNPGPPPQDPAPQGESSRPKEPARREQGADPAPPAGDEPPTRKVRLQRILADAGVAARRACEEMIEAGRVRVNGRIVSTLPAFADPEADTIEVDGRTLRKPQRAVYVMLNKPERVLVSAKDDESLDRATVLDLVQHPSRARLFPVGRLDWDTQGLVLLTTDGELAHSLTHPSFRVPKTYHAIVRGDVGPELALRLRKHARDIAKREVMEARREKRERSNLSGPMPGRRKIPVAVPRLRLLRQEGDKALLELMFVENKATPLREILLACGLKVRKLVRVAVGPIVLKGVAVGEWRELTPAEVRLLKAAPSSAPPEGSLDPQLNPARPAQSRGQIARERQARAAERRRDADGQHADSDADFADDAEAQAHQRDRRPLREGAPTRDGPRDRPRDGSRDRPLNRSRDDRRPAPRQGPQRGARTGPRDRPRAGPPRDRAASGGSPSDRPKGSRAKFPRSPGPRKPGGRPNAKPNSRPNSKPQSKANTKPRPKPPDGAGPFRPRTLGP